MVLSGNSHKVSLECEGGWGQGLSTLHPRRGAGNAPLPILWTLGHACMECPEQADPSAEGREGLLMGTGSFWGCENMLEPDKGMARTLGRTAHFEAVNFLWILPQL